MNIHKSQLFWCELQGYKVLTHCHMLSQLGGCQKAARLLRRLSARTWRRPGFLMNDTLRVAVARSTAITVSKVPPGGRDGDRWMIDGGIWKDHVKFCWYTVFLLISAIFGGGIIERIYLGNSRAEMGFRILKWRFELRRRFKEYLPSGYLTVSHGKSQFYS